MGLCRRHVLTNELAGDSLTTSRTRQPNPCQHMHSENPNGTQAAHTIYGLVIEAAGVPASRVLFVGDTPAADIEGPRSAGMRAIHIDQFMAALAGGRTDPDVRSGRSQQDNFNAAFRDACGTISPDLDLES